MSDKYAADLPMEERRKLAIEYLRKNAANCEVTVAVACRIYHLNYHATQKHLKRRGFAAKGRMGDHNLILSTNQLAALKDFVKTLYERGFPPTKQMLFAVIKNLRENQQKSPPSWRWFQKFLLPNSALFRAVKAKPIAQVRIHSHEFDDVRKWHQKLAELIAVNKIDPANMWNFAETGVRVGCAPGETVILPAEVREVYLGSSEDRKSVTIAETINTLGGTIPPVLIIQGKVHMENWFHENLQGDELIMLSDSGYINDRLALQYMEHFIRHTYPGSDESRLLLLDNHASHTNEEFVLLAAEHNVFLFTFPSHMTQCFATPGCWCSSTL